MTNPLRLARLEGLAVAAAMGLVGAFLVGFVLAGFRSRVALALSAIFTPALYRLWQSSRSWFWLTLTVLILLLLPIVISPSLVSSLFS
jgi:hypothetical protein